MTKPEQTTGIYCPSCGKKAMHVTDTRPVHGGIRRRRECVECGERVTTIEKIRGGKR